MRKCSVCGLENEDVREYQVTREWGQGDHRVSYHDLCGMDSGSVYEWAGVIRVVPMSNLESESDEVSAEG